MSVLLWILSASLLGGLLSVGFAAAVALRARASWIPMLVSYAIGALLGAVFLEILPHALEHGRDVQTVTATILLGILLFFVLEKLVLWRHCHQESYRAHDILQHDHGRSGMMIMIGDTVHNFVDGIIIATAFLTDIRLGFVTSMAIIAHEIPQEVGDFLILMHSGYTRRRALLFNILSSLATVLGSLLAYFALQKLQSWIPALLGIAAASMLYVSIADLIPGLHKRPKLTDTLEQIVLIGLGIASIWVVHVIFSHTMWESASTPA